MPTTSLQYEIDLPAFTGPLDLLLHLIDRDELDITSISLLQVTEQFLSHVAELEDHRTERLIDFVLIASRLLIIKSRALLPSKQDDEAVDGEEMDPAEALAAQLREYRLYKRAALWMASRQEAGLRTHLRISAPRHPARATLVASEISIDDLLAALRFALERSPDLEAAISDVTRVHKITIEDQITRLKKKLDSGGAVSFSALLNERPMWLEVTITFLAVLELIKRHEVEARQSALFGPIEIVRNTARPVYDRLATTQDS